MLVEVDHIQKIHSEQNITDLIGWFNLQLIILLAPGIKIIFHLENYFSKYFLKISRDISFYIKSLRLLYTFIYSNKFCLNIEI